MKKLFQENPQNAQESTSNRLLINKAARAELTILLKKGSITGGF